MKHGGEPQGRRASKAMGFSFQRFTDTGGRFAPRVSIRAGGALGLSQGALRQFELEDGVWYVVLHFDKGANVIGLQPTRDSTEPGAVKLAVRRYTPKAGDESVSCSVSAKSFLDYFKIPYKHSRSYAAERDAESGFIIVKLDAPSRDDGDVEEVQPSQEAPANETP